MTHITEFLILSEPTQVPREGAADSSGNASNALGYCLFAVVMGSVIAAVLILNRPVDGEQKWSRLRVLAAGTLATVAVVVAVAIVGMCLDSVRGLFS
jgi:hypothetical protein